MQKLTLPSRILIMDTDHSNNFISFFSDILDGEWKHLKGHHFLEKDLRKVFLIAGAKSTTTYLKCCFIYARDS